MRSAYRTLVGAAMLAMVTGQGVITSATGDSGTSKGLLVNQDDPNDANLISTAEITANVVNECGRTILGGNMDIGENTENALASGDVTQVTKGSSLKVNINQVNASGVGPYTCDLDPQSNTLGASGQTKLTVKETDSNKRAGTTTLTVSMPKDLACSGSSAGNVCTVRCKNAQDFGGCVAVQQTDITPLAGDNPPSNITIAATLAQVEAQVQQDQKDLPAAIAANQAATKVEDQGPVIAQALLDAEPSVVAAQKAEVKSNVASADSAAASTASNSKNNGNAKANGGNTKANGANAKANGATAKANGANAKAAGANTQAAGANTQATGGNAKAAGANAKAAGANAKAAGANTQAAGANTQAAGTNTQATGANAKAAGANAKAANKNGNKRDLHRIQPRARRFQRGKRYVTAGAAFEDAAGN